VTIGTSLGGFYEDEHHYESRDYMSEKGGKVGGNVADYNNVGIVINPGDPGTGLTQDQNEFTIEGGDLNDQPGLIKQASDRFTTPIGIAPMVDVESGTIPLPAGAPARPITGYKIIDRHTKEQVGSDYKISDPSRATTVRRRVINKIDKMDNEYGAYRYRHEPIYGPIETEE